MTTYDRCPTCLSLPAEHGRCCKPYCKGSVVQTYPGEDWTCWACGRQPFVKSTAEVLPDDRTYRVWPSDRPRDRHGRLTRAVH